MPSPFVVTVRSSEGRQVAQLGFRRRAQPDPKDPMTLPVSLLPDSPSTRLADKASKSPIRFLLRNVPRIWTGMLVPKQERCTFIKRSPRCRTALHHPVNILHHWCPNLRKQASSGIDFARPAGSL